MIIEDTNRKVKIAVIDSGIDTSISGLDKYVINSTGFEINSEGYIAENSRLPVRNLHGTTVAMIIRHICSDVEFISINILNEYLSTDGRILAYALSSVFNYKPDIIHMSLGTLKKRYIFPLRKIVKEAERLKIPMVAAAHNIGKVSYPAYLKNVIGVKADNFEKSYQYSYRKGFFYAPIGTSDINCIKDIPEIQNAKGTSMAAAYITGHLARIIKNNNKFSHDEAKGALLQELIKEELVK